jgi:small subunit ribosomal protein S2
MLPRDRVSQAMTRNSAPAIVGFLTAGYPDPANFLPTLQRVCSAADAVELGVPFSDPMADGVTIQRSSEQAIASGVNLHWIFDQLAAREFQLEAPVLMMSYLNPLLAFGLQDLLEAGVHFGHQTRRWNPKMRRFIFAERSGIYIIDLQKTLRQLEVAQELLRSVVLKGENVLFVCTKRQLKGIIEAEAEKCGAYHVTERWLGGTLTNFQTIKRQIKRLKELEQGLTEGEFQYHTKKEQLLFERERQKLDKNLSGIKNMGRLPGALFVVDAKKERIAVAEANRLGLPVVAIVDTNADPEVITVPVPGNDDAIRAVSLLTNAMSDVIIEARRLAPARDAGDEAEAVTYSTETGVEAESESDRRKRAARRKRRPKPEAIAARLKTDDVPAGAPAESTGGEG